MARWLDARDLVATTGLGSAAELEYWLHLGRFIDSFSKVESFMVWMLWKYAGVKSNMARAIFSDARIDRSMDLIRRIAQVTDISEEAKVDLTYIFTQLRIIATARNDLTHYGAKGFGGTRLTVSNWRAAIREPRITPISPQILLAMCHDLHKIQAHLVVNHLFRGVVGHENLLHWYQPVLAGAWQYKPPEQQGS